MIDTIVKEKVDAIMKAAKFAEPKGDYSVYRSYRRQLEDLGLIPKEYQDAVKKLAKILKV